MKTAIEHIADAMYERESHNADKGAAEIEVAHTLVSEQCMMIYIDGKPYNITVEAL